jgi:hypothetical protein
MSQVIIRANTLKEEFQYLLFVLGKLDFYRKNNYQIVLPENPKLQKMGKGFDKNKMFELFMKEEYREDFYKKGLKYLRGREDVIEKHLKKIRAASFEYDFKLFDQYTVRLTKYGPGGSYNYGTGHIIMQTFEDGSFKRKYPVETVIHEIIHIGVEESVVQKRKLSHWEKEELVEGLMRELIV